MFFINPPFGNYLNLPQTISIKGSYTLEPRSDLIQQIFKTLRYYSKYGGWVNKIGLRNPGLDYAIKNYHSSHIVSIAILEEEEIPKILNKIPTNMNIELNISCPNVDKNLCHNNLSSFLNAERKWCIIKLSPLVSYNLIDNYYKQGFRQFHCSNTVPVKEGGLSGKNVMNYNKEIITYLTSQYEDVEIIAGGGITDIYDVKYYKKLGATHFAASTVFFCPFLFFRLYYDIINQK